MGLTRALASVVTVGLMASGCGPSGSGTLVTESRSVQDFDQVKVASGIDVRLTVNPGATTEVSVTYDDNLLDRIVTEVLDGMLIVETGGSLRVTGGGRFVTVVVPSLDRLEASGGSDVIGHGTSDSLTLKTSGGSDVDLSDLTVRQMAIDTSGGSDATVLVTEEITGEASGGSDVTVLGNPPQVNIETSGGADVGSA